MKYSLSPVASPGIGIEIEAKDNDDAITQAEKLTTRMDEFVQFRLHRIDYEHPDADALDAYGSHKAILVATIDTDIGMVTIE